LRGWLNAARRRGWSGAQSAGLPCTRPETQPRAQKSDSRESIILAGIACNSEMRDERKRLADSDVTMMTIAPATCHLPLSTTPLLRRGGDLWAARGPSTPFPPLRPPPDLPTQTGARRGHLPSPSPPNTPSDAEQAHSPRPTRPMPAF
jgi:hypothetical protein